MRFRTLETDGGQWWDVHVDVYGKVHLRERSSGRSLHPAADKVEAWRVVDVDAGRVTHGVELIVTSEDVKLVLTSAESDAGSGSSLITDGVEEILQVGFTKEYSSVRAQWEKRKKAMLRLLKVFLGTVLVFTMLGALAAGIAALVRSGRL